MKHVKLIGKIGPAFTQNKISLVEDPTDKTSIHTITLPDYCSNPEDNLRLVFILLNQ